MEKIVLALIEKDVNKFMIALFVTSIASFAFLLFYPVTFQQNPAIIGAGILGFFSGTWALLILWYYISEKNREKKNLKERSELMLETVSKLIDKEKEIIKECASSAVAPVNNLLVQGLFSKRLILNLSPFSKHEDYVGQMTAVTINPDYEPYLIEAGILSKQFTLK